MTLSMNPDLVSQEMDDGPPLLTSSYMTYGALGQPGRGALGASAVPSVPGTAPRGLGQTLASYDAISNLIRPDNPTDPLFMQKNNPSRSGYLALLQSALDFAARSGERTWLRPGSTMTTPLSNAARSAQVGVQTYEGLENQRENRALQNLALAAKLKEGDEWQPVKGADGKLYTLNKKNGTIRASDIEVEPEGLGDFEKLVRAYNRAPEGSEQKALYKAQIAQKNNDKAPEVVALLDQLDQETNPARKQAIQDRITALNTKTPAAQITMNQENAELIKLHNDVYNKAEASVDTLKSAQRVRELLSQVRTGPGATSVNRMTSVLQFFGGDKAVEALKSAGFDINSPANMDKFEAEVAKLLTSAVGSQGGFSKLTENERKELAKSLVEASKTNEGNTYVLDRIEQDARDQLTKYKSFVEGAGSNLSFAKPLAESLYKRTPEVKPAPENKGPGPVLAPVAGKAESTIENMTKAGEPQVLTGVDPAEVKSIPTSLLMRAGVSELADHFNDLSKEQLEAIAAKPGGKEKLEKLLAEMKARAAKAK